MPMVLLSLCLNILTALSAPALTIYCGIDQSTSRILSLCPVKSYNGALGLKNKIGHDKVNLISKKDQIQKVIYAIL